MPIKVCFNNEIHRFAKLPVNLKALISVITSTFHNQLPQSWSLYYVDSEGDQVTLSHEEDYQSLLESESKDSSSALKIFISPKEGSAGSQTSLNVSVQSQQSLLEKKITKPEEKKSEDYQIIESSEKPKSPAQEKQKQEQETVKQTSQNNREKTAQSDYTVFEDHKLNEVQPRAYPQPYNEGHNHHKLKKILFKLSLKDLPEEKKAKLQEKLRQIEESLTPEEKERLEEKKQKWASKGDKWGRKGGKWSRKGEKWGRKGSCSRSRSGCHSRGNSKGRDGFKLKHLYKRLASPDLPEEEKLRISEKVKEIEASLTPEQKARLEEKKEKWAKKSSCGRSRSRCHSKGRGDHKLKHIFIKLSMKDLPEEKRARLTEKLKQIEESLTPEQKAEYEQKKEKWQKKAALMEEHFKAQFEFKVDEQGRPIHPNIACVNCKTVPVAGVRYKCTICPEFNLCETCEATVDHPHPLLKIKNPAMMMMFWKPRFGGKHHGHHGGPHRGHHGHHGHPGHHGHHGERGPFGGPHGHHGHHGERGPVGGPHGGHHGHHGPHGHHGHHGHRGHHGDHGERGGFFGRIFGGFFGGRGHHGGRGPFEGPEGRPNKGAFKLFKLFKKLTKLQESAQKGDTEKINKLREKLAKKLPEEANKIVEPVFKLITEKADQETLRQAVEQAKDQLAGFFHPEDKEQVLRQWNHFQEMRQRHQEFKRQFQGEGHFGGKHHHKMWKFPPHIREKVLKVKEALPNEDFKKICKYVAQAPEELSVDQLVAAYKP